jgi:hypothetical protein
VQLLLGAWLFISPWLLGYTEVSGASANAYLIGAALVVFAIIALYAPKVWEEWISLVLGFWLIMSPWFMGFNQIADATQNAVLVGIASVVLALWVMLEHGYPRRLVRR